jgi:hypothetical protein
LRYGSLVLHRKVSCGYGSTTASLRNSLAPQPWNSSAARRCERPLIFAQKPCHFFDPTILSCHFFDFYSNMRGLSACFIWVLKAGLVIAPPVSVHQCGCAFQKNENNQKRQER